MPRRVSEENEPTSGGITPALGNKDDAAVAVVPVKCAKVGPYEIDDLEAIGNHVRRSGILRVSLGQAMVHVEKLGKVMDTVIAALGHLEAKAKKTGNDYGGLAKLAHAVAQISGRLTEAQHLLLEIEKLKGIPIRDEEPRPQRKSFEPRQIVG